MKLEINDSSLVNEIVKKVVEQIAPLFKHNSKNSGNELMTVEEVANYLKTKKPSIYDKVHSKSIPFLKYGSSLRFKRKDVDIWLRNPYDPALNNYNLNHNGRG